MATHIESRELAGISAALVEKYSAAKLVRLLDARSAPNYAFYYDRGADRDGSNICGPFPCASHVASGAHGSFLAIALVEESMQADGTKWVEVDTLPDELRIAGEVE